jgi:[ribosomal protein S5]-alanine N-acetyltransferase
MELPGKFRTRRLLLTRIGLDEMDDMLRMHRDERVMRTLGGPRPDAAIMTLVHELDAHWTRHGYGWWALRDPDSGSFIGRGGLRRVQVAGQPEIEVAYGLLPEFWGRGLATEFTRVAVAQGFVTLGLEEIVACTLPGNRASRRVMEKAGFTFERDIEHAGLHHVLYRLTARAWIEAPLARGRTAARAAAGVAVPA